MNSIRIMISIIIPIVGTFLPVSISALENNVNILFIGNSFSVWNNLPDVITRMADAGKSGSTVTTRAVVAGGATLETLWDNFYDRK